MWLVTPPVSCIYPTGGLIYLKMTRRVIHQGTVCNNKRLPTATMTAAADGLSQSPHLCAEEQQASVEMNAKLPVPRGELHVDVKGGLWQWVSVVPCREGDTGSYRAGTVGLELFCGSNTITNK